MAGEGRAGRGVVSAQASPRTAGGRGGRRRRAGTAGRDHGAAARSGRRLPLGPRAELRDHRALHDRGSLRGRRRDRAAVDAGELRDELGDLLLQVVYHARIAEEAGAFALPDVIRAVSDKMVRRHPHVFGSDSRRQDRRRADRATGSGSRRWSAPRDPNGRRARRRRRRAAGADPRGEAAGPGGPRRLRLARRRRGARQDRRGDRGAGRGPRRGRPRCGSRGIRRPDVRDGEPGAPSRDRPGGGAAGGQRQVHPALRVRSRPRSPPTVARPPSRRSPRWTRSGTPRNAPSETRALAAARHAGPLRRLIVPGLCRKRTARPGEGAERAADRNVAILGASGYTGAELVRLIATHPAIRIAALTADRKAGQAHGRSLPAPAPSRPAAADRQSTRSTSAVSTSCSAPCPTPRARR